MDWQGKVVWITGASSGIGEELVRQLAAKGARIILSARNGEKLISVRDAAGLKESDSMVHPMDVSDFHHFNKDVAVVLDRFGHIDVLINNAGVTQRSKTAETDIGVDVKLMNINYFGTIALTKALLPHFIDRKSGVIAVTSSVAGKIGTPLRSAYCASKFALHGFFESLRAEVHSSGIQVTIACPGFIRTEISRHALTGDGSIYGKSDPGQQAGLTVEHCVREYIEAIEKGKEEAVISGSREKVGVWMGRLFPSQLRKMVRKMGVT